MYFNWINDSVCIVEGLDSPLRYEARDGYTSREEVELRLSKVAYNYPRATVYSFDV